MYFIKVNAVQYYQDKDQTEVRFELVGKEADDIEKRVLGFAGQLDTKEIKKELKKYLDVVNTDIVAAKKELKLKAERLQNQKKIDTMNEELQKEIIK